MPLPERIQSWLRHDTHPAIQFIKYGISGGCAFVSDVITFYLLAWHVFPALTPDDKFVTTFKITVEDISTQTQTTNYIICRTCSFLVSNFVAYVLNVLFVFKPGRHSRLKEFGLFYLASGISFAIGTALSSAAIPLFGITSTTALGINVIVSLSINYAARKYIIFHG